MSNIEQTELENEQIKNGAQEENQQNNQPEIENEVEETNSQIQKSKPSDVQSLKENNVKTSQASNNIFDELFLDYPKNLPTEPLDFNPPDPRRFYRSMILGTSHLAKRIYLEMMRAISAYGELLNIAPDQDKKTIENLQNQMQILSIAMLNIYGRLGPRQQVPFMNAKRPPLPKNYQVALQEMYDRVYHIHSLVLRFLDRTGDEFRSTLIIILTNLKSQLKSLNSLQ